MLNVLGWFIPDKEPRLIHIRYDKGIKVLILVKIKWEILLTDIASCMPVVSVQSGHEESAGLEVDLASLQIKIL